jgi:pimeloyl-ACP methyl ester carboxylesterase
MRPRSTRAALITHDLGAMLGWALVDHHPERFTCHAALSVGALPAFRGCRDIRQREKSWYTLLFQYPGMAEKSLAQDDWRLFREWARHHPEVEHWIADLSREGALTAALNWYRANVAMPASERLAVRVPTLGLWSDGDAFLIEEQMVASGRYVAATGTTSASRRRRTGWCWTGRSISTGCCSTSCGATTGLPDPARAAGCYSIKPFLRAQVIAS